MPQGELQAKCSDSDFINFLETIGPAAYAKRFRLDISAVYRRGKNLEKKYRRQITAKATGNGRPTRHNVEHAARLHFDVLNGTVLVGSDAHLWPGSMTAAMRAFIKFAGEIGPRVIVLNGDVLDFPKVSRHPPIGWESQPEVADEIEFAQGVLRKIEDAAPRNSKLVWTLGNHDGRFETRLATVAHEYARLHGFHLKDYFPRWQACWSAWINADSDPCVIKHRFRSGVHAPHNNTLNAGTHMVTGHLHSAKVTPWTDYRSTRYGVDSGCLADPDAHAFVDYTEDGPKNWRSGFAILTFHNGKLLPPELVTAWGKDHVTFRGSIIKV